MTFKQILNDNHYSTNGIIKHNDLFYIKINNKIQLINIDIWNQEISLHANNIIYELVKSIDNYELDNNLELHFTILFIPKKKINLQNIKQWLDLKYNNFDFIYINNNYESNFDELISLINDKKNFYFFNNVTNSTQIENLFLGTATAKSNSIIIPIFDDYESISANFLNELNKIYLSTRCMLTYEENFNYNRHNFMESLKKNEKIINLNNKLTTWRREIFFNILNFDFLFNDSFSELSYMVILIYLKEIANDRIAKINNNNFIKYIIPNIDVDNKYINIVNIFFEKNKFVEIYAFNENNMYNDNLYKNIYNSNKTELLVTEILKFLYKDIISENKHLFNLSYLFCNYNFLDKYNHTNPLVNKTIEVNCDIKKNIIDYTNFINNNIKIKLINKSNYILNYDIIDINNLIYDYLKENLYENIIDFQFINFVYNINKKSAKINVLIPVKGRTDNLRAVIKNFLENSKEHDIMLTVIEYNNNEHLQFCKDNLINYISINCKIYDFNKSLLANFAFVLYKKLEIDYNFILFHDVDIIIQNEFFSNIFNLDYNNSFIQPYYKKRVLWASENISEKIRNKELDFNLINYTNNSEIYINQDHFSCGGSIFMKKEMFYNIGGLDYYYFDCYGAEDVMLFMKLLVYYNVEFSNLESSNILHLWHKRNEDSHKIPKTLKYNFFSLLSLDYKKKLLDLFKNHLESCIV